MDDCDFTLEELDELEDCSVWCKQQEFEDGFIYTSHLMLNLSHGSISIKDKEILLKTEEALNNYFTCLYSDIKSVHYDVEEDNNKIDIDRKLIANICAHIVF